MPRKQNGFGNSNSFAFKKSKSIGQGKSKGAAGSYPSNRRYGTSVQRTIIESYNLNSDWVKWRRGFEYYNKGAWYRLKDYDPITQTYEESQIKSKLYQGTEYEVDVVFDGHKFATKNADSNNHYVMKRTTVSNPDIGVITEVQNDQFQYPEQKAYREIYCKINPGTEVRLVTKMIGERLSDGETEATLSWVLTGSGTPALFVGKSWPEIPTTVTAEISEAVFDAWAAASGLNVNDLVGKIVYTPSFFQERPIDEVSTFEVQDARDYWGVTVVDKSQGEVIILDNDREELPPSLYDINSLEPIISDPNGKFTLEGTYIYEKNRYQRFYGNQYLTGELATEGADQVSYSVMPYIILGAERRDGFIQLKSAPFISEFKFTKPTEGSASLVFSDWSFTKFGLDEYDGVYYHKQGAPTDKLWTRLDTDVDPWMDEVFTSGNPLSPATIYTCSCPNYSNSILRTPQDICRAPAEVGEEFSSSYKRGGLTTLEIVFALAQGLNLDEVETAYVILNSKF